MVPAVCMGAPMSLPQQVIAAHAGWDAVLVQAPYSTATWRLISPGGEIRYAKVAWTGLYPTLAHERDRTSWAHTFLPVPHVVDHGTADGVEWLVSSARPGLDATRLTSDPAMIVPIFGRGLRAFHDQASVEDCPFDFRLDAAIDHCRRRVNGDEGTPVSRGDFHEDYKHLTPTGALAELEATRPPSEDLVVCHGDYCFPNVLVEDGRVTGYLDLGELGVADRWWDLGVGTWTCDWNVGLGWQDLFLESYGIERDEDRLRFYRLMYDLAS